MGRREENRKEQTSRAAGDEGRQFYLALQVQGKRKKKVETGGALDRKLASVSKEYLRRQELCQEKKGQRKKTREQDNERSGRPDGVGRQKPHKTFLAQEVNDQRRTSGERRRQKTIGGTRTGRRRRGSSEGNCKQERKIVKKGDKAANIGPTEDGTATPKKRQSI